MVAQAIERLTAAGLLGEVAAVRPNQVGDVESAVVVIPLVAPSATTRSVDLALADLPHQCVIADRPAAGATADRSATKDGRTWPVGTQADVSWITEGTTPGLTIASAIPARYDAYATIVIADDDATRQSNDALLLRLLREHTATQPWWLGYLDTGAHDVVFGRVPKVIVYSGWSYVLVQAGPTQADTWRDDDAWRGRLPELIFPVDRSWLVSMLWDDDWRCVGGPLDLIHAILTEIAAFARQVGVDEVATPPGHTAR